ncbi:Zinc finger, RING/FYVE/PHD-type [Cordyceps fumosorosea ARSEF 2679]|uniref:Zinc finger, RING/FYVE/PHD-type n=1 Tax=Cordyceps fumosorosea (strain ARSEF 2679) TaxID=1081104 RepID=A0A168CMD7_CORFA|nr:Zinc finger, RING/FYVE/PHD-type [Cordyceps fumosorosea ARSEF 2679]OAA71556.1 Zinc finger, RING/FYVE/PHD-type [Cordyceps fumosorosea ARSEF 2679]
MSIRARPILPNFFWPGDYSQAGPANWSRNNSYPAQWHAEATEKPAVQEETGIPEEAWVRHLRGVFVNFGPGATVAYVAMPWDSSAVRLSRLPKGSLGSNIAGIFHQLGFQVLEANINPLPSGSQGDVADITMDDPAFAQQVVDIMAEDETCELNAERVVPYHNRAARFDAITRNKVSCSWHKPIRSITINYASEDTAWKVYNGFARGDYRIFQSRVRPTRPKPFSQPSDGLADSMWELKIDNVPASASRRDISEEIDVRCRPANEHDINLSSLSYNSPLEASVDQIVKKLSLIGPLDPTVTTASDTFSRRSKLTVRFVDVDHATEAVKKLDNTPLPFFPQGKLTVQQVSTIRTQISERVYEAASQDIEALYGSWKKDFVYTTISPPRKGSNFCRVKFEGQLHDKVVSAHAEFASIVAGELLTEDGGALWAASIATNAWAYNELRSLEKKHGILILIDKQQRTLRMLGPREMFGTARADIAKVCSQDPRLEFSIGMDPADADAVPWLLGGGYQHIRNVVGEDKVALDVASQPRRLIVSGSDVDLQVAQMLWSTRSKQQQQQQHPGVGVDPEICTLCGHMAEDSVYTRCRHLYCVTCFEAMCLSCAGTPARTPAVRCYGNGGKCKELLTLAAIQENVSSSALERIFERMFTTYLSSNSDCYRHCPGSTCEQVYRVKPLAEGAKPATEFEFNCPKCLVAICSRCHVSHDTLHCPFVETEEGEDSW